MNSCRVHAPASATPVQPPPSYPCSCLWSCSAPAQQTFGVDITSSALSKPPKFLPLTNPSTRRPRTGVTMQAASLPHFLSRLATVCILRPPPPHPSLAGCQRLRPPLLHHRQDAEVLAVPRLHPRRAVTSPSAWRPTLRALAPRSPPCTRSWHLMGLPTPSFVAPHKAPDALARRAASGC